MSTSPGHLDSSPINYHRLARAILGIAAITSGLFLVKGPIGLLIAAVGLLPLATAILNRCPAAPAWRGRSLGSSSCARPSQPSPEEKSQ